MREGRQEEGSSTTMYVVPFSLNDLYAGLGECRGLLKREGDELHFEIQVQDAIAGILKSAVSEIRIPVAEVVSLELTEGWLGTSWLGVKLVLQTSNVERLSEMPGASQGRVQLKIARKDIEAAQAFIRKFYDEPVSEALLN